MKLRWTGNNTDQLSKLLADFHARAEPDGATLHLVGIGLNTHISVGDTLIIEGSRLGIRRDKPQQKDEKYVTWEGDNLLEIDDFLLLYGVRIEVISDRLLIHGGHELIASIGRGDRITKASSGDIVISRAGQHHRN